MQYSEDIMPELKDIMENIHRFNAIHPQGRFIYAFIGFKKDKENICEECGDFFDCPDEKKTIFGGFGHLDELRNLSNELRNEIEDNVEFDDEDDPGFVNF